MTAPEEEEQEEDPDDADQGSQTVLPSSKPASSALSPLLVDGSLPDEVTGFSCHDSSLERTSLAGGILHSQALLMATAPRSGVCMQECVRVTRMPRRRRRGAERQKSRVSVVFELLNVGDEEILL